MVKKPYLMNYWKSYIYIYYNYGCELAKQIKFCKWWTIEIGYVLGIWWVRKANQTLLKINIKKLGTCYRQVSEVNTTILGVINYKVGMATQSY